MHRIDTPTAAQNLFGDGKNGFRDGNPQQGVRPTQFNAKWANNIQEEVSNVIEGAGLVLDVQNNGQLLQAMNKFVGDYSVAKLDTVSQLSTVSSDLKIVQVGGYSVVNDGGGGVFNHTPGNGYVNDNVIAFAANGGGQWVRALENNTVTAAHAGLTEAGLSVLSVDAVDLALASDAFNRFYNFLLSNTTYTVLDAAGVVLQQNGVPVKHAVKRIAHRGWAASNLENTMAGFTSAYAQGAKHIELDIQESSDRTFVIYHDTNWSTKTNGSGISTALPLATIQGFKYKASAGTVLENEVPPTLDDVFSWAKDKNVVLYPELQKLVNTQEAIVQLTKMVKLYNLANKIVVQGYKDSCPAMRQYLPSTRLCFVTSLDLLTAVKVALLTGNCSVAYNYTNLLAAGYAEAVKLANQCGVELIAWIVPNQTVVGQLAAIGVNAVMSDVKMGV